MLGGAAGACGAGALPCASSAVSPAPASAIAARRLRVASSAAMPAPPAAAAAAAAVGLPSPSKPGAKRVVPLGRCWGTDGSGPMSAGAVPGRCQPRAPVSFITIASYSFQDMRWSFSRKERPALVLPFTSSTTPGFTSMICRRGGCAPSNLRQPSVKTSAACSEPLPALAPPFFFPLAFAAAAPVPAGAVVGRCCCTTTGAAERATASTTLGLCEGDFHSSADSRPGSLSTAGGSTQITRPWLSKVCGLRSSSSSLRCFSRSSFSSSAVGGADSNSFCFLAASSASFSCRRSDSSTRSMWSNSS
mmetsp:Transcript_75476/g.161713  ORF Transcript_75476/g.161713 Transcript_75476/m.161713 type:complete len:304 (+) Transcript_75476:315-1226(+)